MGFVNTIADMCAVDLAQCEFRLTVFGGGCIYAEGVKCVKAYSPSEIVIAFKKSGAVIKGDGLVLEKFCGGDVAVKGRVKSIERFCF